eukprot:CAMPEP_0118894190 /NCGR_PEP_ID=MMETSP1166-20130328/3077_1 /TAXON_ID=1104430 /ORGANISM="Chrysoreinhardia sp, Strain CCMP3193" /LENGTH=316 /DNA_ID=CAMNT_0006833077 /DNA_START=72 /DNA_END=1021 /DNA_ORIENTATION=+
MCFFPLRCLNDTVFAGWLVHALLPGTWTLGTPVVGLLLYVAYAYNLRALGCLVAFVGTYQFFFFPTAAGPAFQRFMKELHGTTYYKKCACILAAPVSPVKRLVCFHPHGIFSTCFTFNGVLSEEEGLRDATYFVATGVHYLPIFSVILHWLGNVKKADARTVRKEMATGRSCGILPGGFEEATLTVRGQDRVFLKQRKGFVKFALRYGYKLQPAYTFGEADAFFAFPYFLKLRLTLNALKIPGVIFLGNPLFPIFPRSNVEMTTVVGPPLDVPHIAEPTAADVDEYHRLYIDALRNLFDTYKAQAGYPESRILQVY